MPLSDQSNDFIQHVDLEVLAMMRSNKGPIFSLYLDNRPEKRSAGNPLDRFNLMLQDAEQQRKLGQDLPEYRTQWNMEAGRVRRWLETQQSIEGLGLAVLSSQAIDLWQVFVLPVPMRDRLVTKDAPYVSPLEILLGEYKSTLVVQIDQSSARWIEVLLGRAEEVDSMQAVPVTGGTDEDGARQYARAVAERVQAAWSKRLYDRLVIAGSEGLSSELREELPGALREHLVGEGRLSPVAGLDAVLSQVSALEGEHERDLETQRVGELITSAGNGSGGVFGLDQVLLSVRQAKVKKVRLLVVEQDFHQAGGVCPNCGLLDDGDEEVCPLCGMALRAEPDVIEVALKRVLDAGGEIEILRSREALQMLKLHGRIGVLLDDPSSPPPESDSASLRPISKDGKINPQVRHDETVEESFPASDPPGNY